MKTEWRISVGIPNLDANPVISRKGLPVAAALWKMVIRFRARRIPWPTPSPHAVN
jgi:hypothetical protein